MWTFTYDADANETTIKWREYSETVSGRVVERSNGFPLSDDVNEAVNEILESINSVPDGLKATQEFRPAMIEYETVNDDPS